MDLELVGKTALVTGGSRGIGRAVAAGLAGEGCRLHLAGRTLADLEDARREILALHQVDVALHAIDLSEQGAAPRLAAACGQLDILVNNAGAIPGGSIDLIDDRTWKRAWDLKVFGYVGLMREVLARMQERGQGVIVNVIGTGGERPAAHYIAGAGANSALMAMTRALGSASVEHGVRVVGVNPGLVETDRMVTLLSQRARERFGDAGRWRELLDEMNLPFGRPARSSEVADIVCFLASSRASYISGTIVTIVGGAVGRSRAF
jgi:NAD(P)-dependent dehydrogenase (short-subunit alcohol dehydrogenase family)